MTFGRELVVLLKKPSMFDELKIMFESHDELEDNS